MAEQTPPGQCMLYTLFKATPAWSLLPKAEKSRAIAEYLAAADDFKGRLTVRSYSTIGIRRDTDFLLWLTANELPRRSPKRAHGPSGGLIRRSAYAKTRMTV